ncbi:MAG: tetratricopeptide repeat protein [Sphingorhabdus sp.]
MGSAAKSFWHIPASVLAVAVFCTALAAQPASKGNADALEAIGEAAEYRDQQNLRAANVAALNAIKADPKWPMGHIARAEISLGLFDAITAKAELERALSLGVPREELNHLIGEALWLLGELELAEKTLLRPGLTPRRQTHADRILGRVYMDKGELDNAGRAFDRALKLGQDDSMLWTDIGRFRLVSGNQKGAIEASDRAIKLNAENVRALEFRGRMTREQYGLATGLAWFERALAINADDVPTLEEYAATLGELGRNRDMLAQARKIISLDSKNGRAYYMQAVIAARAGDYGLAQRVLALAGSRINELPGALLLSGISEYQMGNFNKAIDIFKRLLDAQPHNIAARKFLARAMYKTGDAEGALEEIRPLAARADADSYSLNLAGRAFEANGERDRAASGLDAASMPLIRLARPLDDWLSDGGIADAARRNPNNAHYVIPYIRSLMRRGQLGVALLQAQRLRTKNPGVANAHLIEGDVLIDRRSVKSAIDAYNRSAAINFTEPVMLRLAEAYRQQNNGKAQRDLVTAFVANNPTSLPGLRLLAYYHLDDGNWNQAIAPLEYVLWKTGYNDSILLANLARAWSGSGDHEKAASYAAIAYRIDPANPMVTHVYGQILLRSGKRPKAAYELLYKAAQLMPDNKQARADFKKGQAAYKK